MEENKTLIYETSKTIELGKFLVNAITDDCEHIKLASELKEAFEYNEEIELKTFPANLKIEENTLLISYKEQTLGFVILNSSYPESFLRLLTAELISIDWYCFPSKGQIFEFADITVSIKHKKRVYFSVLKQMIKPD